jgi:hypothetical protein
MKTFDVPDSIPRSKVRAFLEDLGLPNSNLIELNVGTGGVYVEMWALDEDGRRYVTPGTKEAARHRIAIPLDRDA